MNASSATPMPAAASLTIASVLAVMRRRNTLWLAPMVACFVLALLSCLFSTSRYQATAEIQVQKENDGSFGLENTVSGTGHMAAPSDSVDYAMTLQTEAGILHSPALADMVIKQAALERTKDYFQPAAPTAFSVWLASWLPHWHALEPLSVPLDDAPNRRYAAEKIFAAHLKVQPIAGTRLIDVSYTDRDPLRAAKVANTVAEVLGEMSFDQRFAGMNQGSKWLKRQLSDLLHQTHVAQAKAAALQRGTGVFGNDASRNVVLQRLDSLNQTLTAAESNRILKESIDQVAQHGGPELISSLSGNSSTGQVASINTSLSLLQGLRQQEADARAELDEDTVRYGPNYPRIAELHARLAGIATAISAETARLGQRAHTDWLVAQKEENSASAAFEKQKQKALQQNDSVIAYQLARQEADSSRDLYEGLLAKLKEANLLQGIRSNNVTVVSPANEPPPYHPSSPNILLRLAAALAAGLFLGLTATVYAELTDDSINGLSEVEHLLGVPLVAILPSMEITVQRDAIRRHKQSRRLTAEPAAPVSSALTAPRQGPSLPVLEDRASIFSEGMRSLRTALKLSGGEKPPQVILVTSCLAAEGKTTLAANLAALFAQGGGRTLLVDADLRRPTLHYYCPVSPCAGLAMALSGQRDVPMQQPFRTIPNLDLLSGNEISPCPSELLGSARMSALTSQWRAIYDTIVIDSPPVLPVSDAMLLAQLSDVTLLVARHKRTPRQALSRAVAALQQPSGKRAPIGVVLNDVVRGSGEFYQYFGYDGGIYAGQSA